MSNAAFVEIFTTLVNANQDFDSAYTGKTKVSAVGARKAIGTMKSLSTAARKEIQMIASGESDASPLPQEIVDALNSGQFTPSSGSNEASVFMMLSHLEGARTDFIDAYAGKTKTSAKRARKALSEASKSAVGARKEASAIAKGEGNVCGLMGTGLGQMKVAFDGEAVE